MIKMNVLRADLLKTLKYFPDDCLKHVLEHRSRLVRGQYEDGKGGKCLMALLSELLPANQRIDSIHSLTRFFTGGEGEEYRQRAEYQSPRWLVRAWDGVMRSIPNSRYGDIQSLDQDVVLEIIEEELAAREQSRRIG